jgi:hypothetical protein
MRPAAAAIAALFACGSAAAAAGAGPAPVSSLSWLSGCWESVRGERRIEEQWMAPRGGSMLGMSRTVVRDSTREFEHMRIEERGGRLLFTAKPSGQEEASFTAISVSESLVVFENPGHDFPRRVLYRKVGADSLVGRIEGGRNGAVRGIDFPMRRVACAASDG